MTTTFRKILNFLVLSFLILGLYNFVSLEKKKTTVFVVGDSTVKNGQGDGAGGLWGWGDPIKYHFDSTKVNVENHARGGTSSRTYQTEGLWQNVYDKICPGDYVLIQFGHNDGGPIDTSKANGTIRGIGNETKKILNQKTGRAEIVHTYGWYLRKYIADTREKGGIPIIISSIPRNDWENGKIKTKPESYPLWAKQVAESEGVAFIDLNKKMTDELNKKGQTVVTGKYFFARDHTHTTAEGAMLNARLVAKGILELENCGLSKYVTENPKYVFPMKIRILLIGDSTVAKGKDGIQGWGEEILKYFDTSRVAIINRARGGRSSRTFYYEKLWEETLTELRPGDYVLMQFGHNDGSAIDKDKMRGSIKGIGDDTVLVTRENNETEIVHSYGWYLTKYISDTKLKDAIPIVFSPIPRREWIDGKVERVSESYGKWSKEVASREKVYFIDLNEITALKYEQLGPEKVAADFFLTDHTHTTSKGADLNAQSIVDGIKEVKCPLRNYLAY